MTTGKKERVGIVGVGRMGLAMLKHLVKHGYQVTACDIDDKQLAKARDAGAATAETPAEVARAADFVIIGVGYDDEVNQVVLGTEGLLANLASGSINAVGLIEAGRLAETTGIDLGKLRAALLMSSGASDALKEWDRISFTWALKDMQIVADLTDKAGLSLPITGAIKELVKDARRIKATNAPKWTGRRDGHDKSIAETPPSTNRLAP